MISSAPETRRQGYVRELMRFMLSDMNQRDMSFSTLYPFKDEFYARLGYVPMPPFHKLQLRVDLMIRWEIPEGYYLKKMSIVDGLEYAKIIHREAITGIHGTVVKSDERWEEYAMSKDPEYVFAFNSDGRPIAFMRYGIQHYGAFRDDDKNGRMDISQSGMFWSDRIGKNMLLNYIHNHADQVVTANIPIHSIDKDYWHWTQRFNIGGVKIQAYNVAMARIVNVERLLVGIPSDVEGDLTVQVKDSICKWNEDTFTFSCDGKKLDIDKTDDKASVEISIEGLTSLVFGTASLETITELKQITGDGANILNDWFSPITPWFTEDF